MHEFRITFSEMRDKFISAWKGNNPLQVNRSNYDELKQEIWADQSTWSGGSPDDMVRYLRDGYVVPGLSAIDTSVIPAKKKRRPRFNDCEGDFRYDMFQSGEENCYLDWTKREITPAITVEFSTGFRYMVKAETIAAYSRWVCQALIALEEAGVDCAIHATISGIRRFAGEYNESSKIYIAVKQEGERCNFLNWSALFSPGCYRQLGFFTILLMAENSQRKAHHGFGQSSSARWNVKWNSEKKTLEITHDASSEDRFPEEIMTTKLIAALAEARGGEKVTSNSPATLMR